MVELVSKEMIEIGARAIMANSGIKWESPTRKEALKHSRSVLEAVMRVSAPHPNADEGERK
jgi:hypothetical protein